MPNATVTTARRVADVVDAKIAESQFEMLDGLVTSIDYAGGAASNTITIDGQTYSNVIIGGDIHLMPGMAVQMLRSRTSGLIVIIGQTTVDARPVQGTVSGVGTTTATVLVQYSTQQRSITCPWVGTAPTVGDSVLLYWWAGNPVIVGKLSQLLPTALTPPYVTPPAPEPPTSGTTIITANSSKSCDDLNWFSGDTVKTWGGDGWQGVYFYGNKLATILNGDVNITKMELYLNVTSGATLTGEWHTFQTQPTVYDLWHELGKSAIGNNGVGVYKTGWIPISPPSDSNYRGCIALQDNDYQGSSGGVFKGVTADSQAGAIRVTWTR